MPGSQNRHHRIKVLRNSINQEENKGKKRQDLVNILLTQYRDAAKRRPDWDKHKNTRLADINDALDQEEIFE